MRIFFNQRLLNDFSELIADPAIIEAQNLWSREDIILKSAIDLRILKTPFGSISLLYGPRQIGKTATLKLFLSRLDDSETIIYTDCSAITGKADLARHLSQLVSGKTTIVLDEVQVVPDWNLALRSLYSEGKLKNCRIWCTGSEARYLLESGERLPGRKGAGKNVFARPWSYREFMDFFYPEMVREYKTVDFRHVNQLWLDEQKINWRKPWQEYCVTGGFPKVIAEFRKNGAVSDAAWGVYVDWILGTWSRLRTPQRSLSAVARRLCETLNSRVGFEAIKKGTDIQSANTIRALIEMQEDHFSLVSVSRYDIQKKGFLPSKMRKIYPIDPFIARVWSAIGGNIRRLYDETVAKLPVDESAFLTQTHRLTEPLEVGYLYGDSSKSEIDFCFDHCAFELKSNGNPTAKQREMLKNTPHAFFVKREKLPLMAYLIGEGRLPASI